MSNIEWNAVAVFNINSKESSEHTYCLCSRVFVRSNRIITEDDNIPEDPKRMPQDQFVNVKKEDITDRVPLHNINTNKTVDLAESVSCYCSSSHTDNLSTDEHDSVNDVCGKNQLISIEALHLSDSGADLTDSVSNDYSFKKYWSDNGQRLVYESWILKYSGYINPEYLQNKQSTDSSSSYREVSEAENLDNTDTIKLSSDSHNSQQDPSVSVTLDLVCEFTEAPSEQSAVEKNHMLIRNLSGSDSYDKLFRECEGWNPLSPISNEYEIEAEHLLNSRCASRTGSLARTVDSMTNVTRLTISSIELSDCSRNSDSLSSVSSVHSSLTSTSSENVVDETVEQQQQRWNDLWTEHYQEEYMKHYKMFVCNATNKTMDETIQEDDFNKEEHETSETEQMKMMGLPLSFSKKRKIYKDKIYSTYQEKSGNKSSNRLDTLPETSRNRIKAAFSIIGVQMNESNPSEMLNGSVECKINNIRSQNRSLTLTKKRNNMLKSNHFYFDDNGDVIDRTADEEELKSKIADPEEEFVKFNPTSTSEDEIERFSEIADNQKVDLLSTKKKKRKRKKDFPIEIQRNPKLIKYWHKRYSIFHLYDKGIKLDEESWFSVTPESIAINTAERCKCDIIIDAFCGAGGNSIQFALKCIKVIAIDIDEKKIEMARHNATIYGVADRIEFIVGDYFQLAHSLKANVVFLSPPWGGPEYLFQDEYDLETLQPKPFSELLIITKQISNNIAWFIPKNSNTHPLILASGPGGSVEIEQNFLDKKLKAITVYMGDLVKSTS